MTARSADTDMIVREVGHVFASGRSRLAVLDRVTFTVARNEFLSIVGPSGCGKSTLFHIMAGLLVPSEGEIRLDGVPITGQRGHVGYMFQRDLLLPWRTVLDNAVLGLEIRGVPRTERTEQALRLVEKFGLKPFARHHPAALSGGMRQRTALMRTFLFGRPLMLLDEPFGALDAQTRGLLQAWLLDVWGEFRKTIVFITHDVDEALFLSDRVLVMTSRPGTIKAEVRVPLPRPRTWEMVTDPAYTRLKGSVLRLIQEETVKAFADAESSLVA